MKFLSFISSFLFAYLLLVALFLDANFLNALFFGVGLAVSLVVFNKDAIKQCLIYKGHYTKVSFFLLWFGIEF